MISEMLKDKLNHINISDIPEEWTSIPDTTKLDLIRFYNVSSEDLSTDDLEILADLFHGVTGSIRWENCDGCGEELCIAEPNSWASF
jgi:hypothetical protein